MLSLSATIILFWFLISVITVCTMVIIRHFYQYRLSVVYHRSVDLLVVGWKRRVQDD